MNPAIAEARRNGWPLTKDEVLQARIELEDRLRHRHAPNSQLPVYTKVEKEKLSEAAKFSFGRQIIRECINFARP